VTASLTTNGKLPDPPTRVMAEPGAGIMPMQGTLANLVISVASAADSIMPWGAAPRERDIQLRNFWPTEPYFSSGLFSMIAQYVAFGWSLEGPPRSVKMSQQVINNFQMGQGPEVFLSKLLVDYFTQDNAAFIEFVRVDNNDPRSPVVTLNHLDSYRCIRTGRRDTPVIYIDLNGNYHELKWWNVCDLSEMPSPIEEARGMQYCALTRMLRAAQILRDIMIVKQEKAGGRFTRQVHLVSGVQTRVIEEAMAQKQNAADAAGLIRYITPLIVASLDPTAKVSKETIDLASVPDDFDELKAAQTYIILMAMAFGTDPQTFAPLPGGGLGSGSEAKVLNMKSRGKGPALFMKRFERIMNFRGVLLPTVVFRFGEQDIAEQAEKADLANKRALTREIMIRSGEITTEVARQMAVDAGDIPPDYLKMMGEDNATEEIVVPSTVPADYYEPGQVTRGKPGPDGPPTKPAETAGDNRPANSNAKRTDAPSQNQKKNPGGTN
jgi:hypothetical protein